MTPVCTAVDGDTVRCSYSIDYRIAGINTPESRTRCAVEKALGVAAKNRMAALLKDPWLVIVPELERDGTYKDDKYGRRIATIYAGGRSVGAVLIEEGHAQPYDGTGPRPIWCRSEQ